MRACMHTIVVQDTDQRLTEDLDKLATEVANIFPDIVKPVADILWFTYQAYNILGGRSTALLYVWVNRSMRACSAQSIPHRALCPEPSPEICLRASTLASAQQVPAHLRQLASIKPQARQHVCPLACWPITMLVRQHAGAPWHASA
jgi:hypothetical protein